MYEMFKRQLQIMVFFQLKREPQLRHDCWKEKKPSQLKCFQATHHFPSVSLKEIHPVL